MVANHFVGVDSEAANRFVAEGFVVANRFVAEGFVVANHFAVENWEIASHLIAGVDLAADFDLSIHSGLDLASHFVADSVAAILLDFALASLPVVDFGVANHPVGVDSVAAIHLAVDSDFASLLAAVDFDSDFANRPAVDLCSAIHCLSQVETTLVLE